MPRAPRICFPGAIYHVIQRGNGKQNIFNDDKDKWHLLKLFLEAKKKFRFLLYCYTLMKNHFHLTIETPNPTPISKIMQIVEGSYAVYFNKKYDRVGHLFQGRFKSILVEKDSYLLELSRYVHLNPIRAGFAGRAEDYLWSSYAIYLGLRKDTLVDTFCILNYFGDPINEQTKKIFKEFVDEAILSGKNDENWLKENLKRKQFLGSERFIKRLTAVKRGQTPLLKYL